MKNEKVIIKIGLAISLLTVCILVTSCSDNWKTVLKKELEDSTLFGGSILLPLLVYTNDSPMMLIETYPLEMETELSKLGVKTEVVGKIIYDSMNKHLPIKVSQKFYQNAYKHNRIKVNVAVDSVYQQSGIKGVVNTYFRNEYGFLSLNHIADSSDSYIIYLLSLHNIYVAYVDFDEDAFTLKVIADILSDTSQYK